MARPRLRQGYCSASVRKRGNPGRISPTRPPLRHLEVTHRPEMMIGPPQLQFSRKLFSAGPCRLSQGRPCTNILYPRAKLGLSLVSFLGLTAFVGCSWWSRLNLDSAAQDSSSTQESSREHQKRPTNYNESYTRNDGSNVYVRHPHAYTQTFEQTVFPGNHTGIARYDTAKNDSPGCVSLTL